MTTAIIGIGNPLLSDDGVGIQVARSLAERLEHRKDVTAMEFCAGGIRLVEAMEGHDRVFLVDSIRTEGGTPGSVYRLDVSDVRETRYAHSSHDASLAVALEFGRMSGMRLPPNVHIWAVEAADVETFGEQLTPSVRRAASQVVAGLLQELGETASPAAGETT